MSIYPIRSHMKQVVVLKFALINHVVFSLELNFFFDFFRDFFEKKVVDQYVNHFKTHLIPGSRMLAINHVSFLEELNKVCKFGVFQSNR